MARPSPKSGGQGGRTVLVASRSDSGWPSCSKQVEVEAVGWTAIETKPGGGAVTPWRPAIAVGEGAPVLLSFSCLVSFER